MTNVVDGLREKFKFVLMRIEKARGREMVARRKTNEALDRTKSAEKKSFYLQHKLDALTDKFFIYSMRIQRTTTSVLNYKNKWQEKQNKYADEERKRVEKLQQDISNLEQQESKYNKDVKNLLEKRNTMAERLGELEKRIESGNESVKFLEKRLGISSEMLIIKKMQRDLNNQRRFSRAQVIIQLRRYLELAKARTSRAEDKVERLVKIKDEMAENLDIQRKVILQGKKELQRLTLRRKKYSSC